MATSPRPELEALRPCPHGSMAEAEQEALGLGPVLDFSANANPLGPPPGVAAATAAADPARYPDTECRRLRPALGAHLGVEAERILVGNGSIDLIWMLAAAYLRRDDTALIVGPTFGEYARAVAIHGAVPVEYRAREARGFAPDLAGVVALIRERWPRLVFLCNPNNPTGLYLERPMVQRIHAACEEGLLVVDEAYLGFVDAAGSLLDLVDDGAVLLRSMTKDYALAGLRLD